jgi:hypothetical protein
VPLTAAERLERLGLVTPDARLAATDLPLLVGVREGLREVLLDHAGHDVQGPALNELDDLLHCRRDRCNCFLRLFAQPLRALVLDGRCGNIVKMRRAYRARTGASPHNATNAGEMP